MELTTKQLKQMIKEELGFLLGEENQQIDSLARYYADNQFEWKRIENDINAAAKGWMDGVPGTTQYDGWTQQDFQSLYDKVVNSGGQAEPEVSSQKTLDDIEFWGWGDYDWIVSSAADDIEGDDEGPSDLVLQKITDNLEWAIEDAEGNLEDEGVTFDEMVKIIYDAAYKESGW